FLVADLPGHPGNGIGIAHARVYRIVGGCLAACSHPIWRWAPGLSSSGRSRRTRRVMTASSLTDRLYDDADTAPIDPLALFEDWYAEAVAGEPGDPHAMALATVDADGHPDVRMVLLNQRDARGFCFFTNLDSD